MWKKLLTVYLIFGVSLAILISLSLYAFQRFTSYIQYADAVDRNHEVISLLNTLKVQLTEGENNQRAFMLFNDSSFYFRYEDYVASVRRTFNEVHHFLEQDAQQRNRLHKLNISMKSQLDYLRSGMNVGYPITNYNFEKAYMEKSLRIIKDMEEAEKKILQQKQAERREYETTTPQNFQIVFVFTLLTFTASFIMLVSQYRRRIIYQEKLERSVVELNQANSEWEQLTYVASHDLQEPLRKIRTFSDLLTTKHKSELGDEGQLLVHRIDQASTRAQSLMVDLVNYNAVVSPREEKSLIDCNDVLLDVRSELMHLLTEKNAEIDYEDLPVVQGYRSQIKLLFKSLIENSLKFAKPDTPLRISISNSIVSQKQLPVEQKLSVEQYHKLTFQDNGIGFENQFSEKIFKIFQRLHGQESKYDGRGIGLAIVRRIVTNHMGFIIARGRPGKGAKFTLYFPVQQS